MKLNKQATLERAMCLAYALLNENRPDEGKELLAACVIYVHATGDNKARALSRLGFAYQNALDNKLRRFQV